MTETSAGQTSVFIQTMHGITSHSMCQCIGSFSLDTGLESLPSLVSRLVDNGLFEVGPDLRCLS